MELISNNAVQLMVYVNAVVGFGAVISAWMAAMRWYLASIVKMPEFDPPVASMDDNPSLHILTAYVQLNAPQNAIEQSSQLNAKAAKWAAISAMLTGITITLGVI